MLYILLAVAGGIILGTILAYVAVVVYVTGRH